MVLRQKKRNNSDQVHAITNIFFLFWRSQWEETFHRPLFWKSIPRLRKVKFTVAEPPNFQVMSTKMLIKNERNWISKFCSMKSCARRLALIWNQPELSSTWFGGVISVPSMGHKSAETPAYYDLQGWNFYQKRISLGSVIPENFSPKGWF